jgi:hypothetical protein
MAVDKSKERARYLVSTLKRKIGLNFGQQPYSFMHICR